MTVEFLRHGSLFGVFIIDKIGDTEKRTLLWTVSWVFEEDSEQEANIWVGVYAARPYDGKPEDGPSLAVCFSEFQLETL